MILEADAIIQKKVMVALTRVKVLGIEWSRWSLEVFRT